MSEDRFNLIMKARALLGNKQLAVLEPIQTTQKSGKQPKNSGRIPAPEELDDEIASGD